MSYTTIRVRKETRDALMRERLEKENLGDTLARLLGEGKEAS